MKKFHLKTGYTDSHSYFRRFRKNLADTKSKNDLSFIDDPFERRKRDTLGIRFLKDK